MRGDNGAQEVGGEGAAPVTRATNCGPEMWEAAPRPTPAARNSESATLINLLVEENSYIGN